MEVDACGSSSFMARPNSKTFLIVLQNKCSSGNTLPARFYPLYFSISIRSRPAPPFLSNEIATFISSSASHAFQAGRSACLLDFFYQLSNQLNLPSSWLGRGVIGSGSIDRPSEDLHRSLSLRAILLLIAL